MGISSFFRRPPKERVARELVAGGRVKGWTDWIRLEGDKVHIRGWMLHPTRPMSAAILRLNGVELGQVNLTRRQDVADAHKMVPHAAESAFEVRIKAPRLEGPLLSLRAEGYGGRGGRELIGVHESHELREVAEGVEGPASPSAPLMKRVSGTDNPRSFAQMGINAAVDLMAAAQKHLGGRVERLLDYGCGSGRVARFLLKLWPEVAFSGCDIDAEAIAWDNQHLQSGAFKVMSIEPPLPYEDDCFDVAVAVSVMTHLTLAEQHRWLAEVRRVIRPGGLFLPSVHGALAALFVPWVIGPLAVQRFTDGTLDGALDGIAPPGYYRSTFQLPSFTREAWAAHFEVVEIIQAGCGGYQDLVVLRKR